MHGLLKKKFYSRQICQRGLGTQYSGTQPMWTKLALNQLGKEPKYMGKKHKFSIYHRRSQHAVQILNKRKNFNGLLAKEMSNKTVVF
jgi:hypothetical protein